MATLLLSFIYDMSWSSTCERRQAAILNWIIHSIAYSAGYAIEIVLPNESTNVFIDALNFLNNTPILENSKDENKTFVEKYFSQPDVIALCCKTHGNFKKWYKIQLKEKKIPISVYFQSSFPYKTSQLVDLSFQTIASLEVKLSSLDGDNVKELRLCHLLNDKFFPAELPSQLLEFALSK